jgi:hypothetical protein
MRSPTRVLVAIGLLAALGIGLHAQAPSWADTNGPYVILRDRYPRASPTGSTVEINGYWTFTLTRSLPIAKFLCIRATAFTVKPSLRGEWDFDGIHFDLSTMRMKTVTFMSPRDSVSSMQVTTGLLVVTPLTPDDESRCAK